MISTRNMLDKHQSDHPEKLVYGDQISIRLPDAGKQESLEHVD